MTAIRPDWEWGYKGFTVRKGKVRQGEFVLHVYDGEDGYKAQCKTLIEAAKAVDGFTDLVGKETTED